MAGFELLSVSWLITLIAIVTLFFIPIKFKSILTILLIVSNAVLTSWLAFPALFGNVISQTFYAGELFEDIIIRIDGLSAWFIWIINFTCITGVIYGSGYIKAYQDSNTKITLHWQMYILFHLSMLWVCMLQHGFAFLLAWEVMSLTSMILVIFDHNNIQTIKAGINYLVQMHVSIVFLTIGFIWVYFQTGSFSFESIGTFFSGNSNIWLFLVFFIGFGLKAGFIPFHTWLPQAHPAAPSHISGVMSGVIVKLGIYGIIRIIAFLKADYLLLGEIILSLSVLTGIYGIINAAVYRDFKRMLAFCTIENIGIIGIGIGIGLMGMGNNSALLYYFGFGGALLHVLNHSLVKSLLFYSAGSVYLQTHTRDMDKLGGLIKYMPKTAVFFLIGAIAIAGISPLNGFISEFIIYSGIIEGIKSNYISQTVLFVLSFAGLAIIGGLSMLTFTKSFGTIFLGNYRDTIHQKPQEVSFVMLLPQYVIVAIMFVVAFSPQFYFNIIYTILINLTQNIFVLNPTVILNYSISFFYISVFSVLFVVVIVLIWWIRSMIIKSKIKDIAPTWGCGYVAPNTRMQYTGKSFSKPLGKIFNFLLIEKKHFNEIEAHEIFPKKRKYESDYADFFEHRFIDSISHRLVYTANYFRFIQNGRVQSYVLYGIVFIVAIFVLTALSII